MLDGGKVSVYQASRLGRNDPMQEHCREQGKEKYRTILSW